ncbi:MAG: hypothetical protein Q9M25_02235 [Mariprofundaceae bacterium]|nr:hypothetical protein [Mariprofundaceae bacterium]
MAARESDASTPGSSMHRPRLQAIRPATTADIYAVYKLNCQSFSEAWSVMALGMWQERGDDLDVCYDENNCLAAYYLAQDVLDEVHIMQIAVTVAVVINGDRHSAAGRQSCESGVHYADGSL